MRNLKQEDFSGRKRLRADTFVHENYSRIRRRLRDYGDRLHSRLKPERKRAYKTKKKKEDSDGNLSSTVESISSRKENYHDAQEKWGKKDPETPKHNPRLGQFQQSPKIPLSSKPDFKKGKSKRKIHPSCSETHRKPNQRMNACSYDEQKPDKMPSKINMGVSSEQENASRGVKCAPKSVLKNEGPAKSRLTRKETNRKWEKMDRVTDESINSRNENSHDAQEKLGKKDPGTPKQNPRVGQFQQFPTIPLSTKPDFEKIKSKRSVHPACSESHIKKKRKVNACSYNEQKPGKMNSKMNTSVSSEQENASRVVNGTRKTVLKSKGPPKSRLTRKERIENRKKCTFFYLRLWNTMLKGGNEKRLYEIISRTRQMIDYEACDYILIPINIHNHWTAVVINIWNTQMFYYDPMGKGIQNETVIKLFKVFF
ncbi:---NA--- [Paramuricea clavata]|uniref:---NA n=1 Tax=Paramuricea clavata TaxID=317549 RepID=A0A7D9E0U3_PARCT|nr:---NA--- [Paramuricea clavata]